MSPTSAKALGWLAALVVRVWFRLYRVVVVGWEPIAAEIGRGRLYAFALWHGTLFAPILHHRNVRAVTMASRSADGQVITTMLETFRYRVARGSTRKGGLKALDEMVEIMKSDRMHGALTVDGPRGPARVCQSGIVRLARETGAFILPLGCASRKNRRLRSWDRFHVPLPFDKVWVVHGEPFPLDPAWSEDEACRRIGEAIEAANREAERLAGITLPAAP